MRTSLITRYIALLALVAAGCTAKDPHDQDQMARIRATQDVGSRLNDCRSAASEIRADFRTASRAGQVKRAEAASGICQLATPLTDLVRLPVCNRFVQSTKMMADAVATYVRDAKGENAVRVQNLVKESDGLWVECRSTLPPATARPSLPAVV